MKHVVQYLQHENVGFGRLPDILRHALGETFVVCVCTDFFPSGLGEVPKLSDSLQVAADRKFVRLELSNSKQLYKRELYKKLFGNLQRLFAPRREAITIDLPSSNDPWNMYQTLANVQSTDRTVINAKTRFRCINGRCIPDVNGPYGDPLCQLQCARAHESRVLGPSRDSR